MGLFGDDKRRDERLDALEQHIGVLTETVQQNQLDITACRIGILATQAEIDSAAEAIQNRLDAKVSTGDIDPVLQQLNTDLGQARLRLEEYARSDVRTDRPEFRGKRNERTRSNHRAHGSHAEL